MKDIKCADCANYIDDWCDKVKDSTHENIIRDCEHFKQKTNRDTLAQMDNHDLAVFICEWIEDCDLCPGCKYCVHGAKANGLIKWLDAKAETGSE